MPEDNLDKKVHKSYTDNIYNPIEEKILFRPLSRRVAQALKKTSLSPDLVSFFGFLVTVAAGYSFLSHSRWVPAVLIYIAFFFDKLDGDLARAKGIAGGKGQYVDGFLDFLGEMALALFAAAATGFSNVALIGLTVAAPMIFYYHGLEVPFYLGQVAPTFREAKPSLLKQTFSYGRAKHLLLYIVLVLLGGLQYIFYILPFLILYTVVLFLRNIFVKKLTKR